MNVKQSYHAFNLFINMIKGIQEPRRTVTGDPLPNPRVLSSLIHRSLNAPSSKFSLMLMQWGQFLDHDVTSTAQTRGFENSVPKCCNSETKEPLFTHERVSNSGIAVDPPLKGIIN
jgi:hypothetical protein